MVSSNLALALAQANQRVLLVDADMRRPQIHSYFSHPQQPGLSNFIVGNSEVGDVVRPSGVPQLWLLPSGLIPPNPAELLGSMKFKEFLATLKERFDWVIIDSPPVMAVTDACILAHSAHGVLFVVGSEDDLAVMTAVHHMIISALCLLLLPARFSGHGGHSCLSKSASPRC